MIRKQPYVWQYELDGTMQSVSDMYVEVDYGHTIGMVQADGTWTNNNTPQTDHKQKLCVRHSERRFHVWIIKRYRYVFFLYFDIKGKRI